MAQQIKIKDLQTGDSIVLFKPNYAELIILSGPDDINAGFAMGINIIGRDRGWVDYIDSDDLDVFVRKPVLLTERYDWEPEVV